MQYYDYIGIDAKNRKVFDIVVADSIEQAKKNLSNKGITVTTITEMRDVLSIRKTIYKHTKLKIKKKNVLDFIELLTFMLESDISTYEALQILRDTSDDEHIQLIARPLCNDVRKGISLSKAMQNSGYFEETIVYQVRAGEESGQVGETLKRIAYQLDKDIKFAAQVKNACVYPVTILGVMVIVVWVLLTFVVPSVVETIQDLGVELPLITRIVIGISNSMKYVTIISIIVIAVGTWLFKRAMKNRNFKAKVHTYYLSIPVLGKMLRKIAYKDFSRQLSILQSSGLSMNESLRIVENTVKNVHMQDCIRDVKKMVEIDGASLADAMNIQGEFDSIMNAMVRIGCESGSVPETLMKLADRYEHEVDNLLKKVTSLMEPIMICVIGIVVGVVMISMYLPMFSIIDNIS